MKKILILLVAAFLMLGLAACADDAAPQTTIPNTTTSDTTLPDTTDPDTTLPDTTEPETTIPESTVAEGVSVAGADLSGMTAQEALDAVQSALQNYTITLIASDKTVNLTAKDLKLITYPEVIEQYVLSLPGMDPEQIPVPAGFARFDEAAVMTLLEELLPCDRKNATAEYNKETGLFEPALQQNGIKMDKDTLAPYIRKAIDGLYGTYDITEGLTVAECTITIDHPDLPGAIAELNTYLDLKITYTYEAPGVRKTKIEIPRDTIASFVKLNSKLVPYVNVVMVEVYVTNMSQTYRGNLTTTSFIGTNGYPTGLSVPLYGAALDTVAMVKELYDNVGKKVSGDFIAPYNDAGKNKPYGGDYVEIDLTAQHLWVYRNGAVVVETDFVSGNVSQNYATPNGVFSIYKKATNAWLAGPDWLDFVSYWIPFYGGIGMHDATWRSVFGGEIYKFNGSHGCINMPYSITGKIFSNVTVGMRVLVHGGATEPEVLTQEFTGTQFYQVTPETGSFQLDVKPKYIGTSISYSSSNTGVVTVDKKGNVTVVGDGYAKITVTSHQKGALPEAKFVIEVVVASVCPDGEHSVTDWTYSSGPVCQSRSRTGQCELCGTTVTEQVAAQDHSFTAGAEHCDYGCGTLNPDYEPPVTTDPETTEPETTEPETTEPETTVPETTEPETTEPETTVPETTDPPTTETPTTEASEGE